MAQIGGRSTGVQSAALIAFDRVVFRIVSNREKRKPGRATIITLFRFLIIRAKESAHI